jgi:Zn-dependent M16 (insulinase) family peptidase
MSRLSRALGQQRLVPQLVRPAAVFSASAPPRLLSRRALCSSNPPASHPPASHPAWSVVRSSAVTEHAAVATLYQHRSGAQLLSVVCAEEEKVFGACFKTPVSDDCGIPHILEHSVLCGSRRFPVKEPFVQLMKSSLSTYLNALTYGDRTLFPVASPNAKDFEACVRVYLDACFAPRLGPRVLAQEGWHYECDGSGALAYKGVVFNEMKGVYSSADSRHYRAIQRHLFRGHPIYSIDSGGDPRAIPALTYEAFEAFHKTYYHPANARLFLYGRPDELPISERLFMLQVR